MDEFIKKYFVFILYFLAFFMPFRELLANYTFIYIKFIPDVLISSCFLMYVINKKGKIRLEKFDMIYALLMILGFLSSIINRASIIGSILEIRSIFIFYILFYLMRNIDISKKSKNKFYDLLIIFGIILSCISIVEFVSNKELCFISSWANAIIYASNYARVYSLLNNPNTFATYIFMLIILIYISDFCNKKIVGLLYSLFITMIVLSASRSIAIVGIVFIIYLIIKIIRNKDYKKLLSLLFLTLSVLFLVFILNVFKERYLSKDLVNNNIPAPVEIEKPQENEKTQDVENNDETINNKPINNLDNNIENNLNIDNDNISKNSSIVHTSFVKRWTELFLGKTIKDSKVDGRIFKLFKGLEVVDENLFIGTGFGTFGSSGSKIVGSYLQEKYNITNDFYADNQYIVILVETGLIGLFVYILFIILFIRKYKEDRFKLFITLIILFLGLFNNILELQVVCFLFYTLLCVDNKADGV